MEFRIFTYCVIFFETIMFGYLAGIDAIHGNYYTIGIAALFWICLCGPWCKTFLQEGF